MTQQSPQVGLIREVADRMEHPPVTTFVTLLIIFGIVVTLAIVGVVVHVAFDKADTSILTEAMRIVGYGGPTGSAANNIASSLRLSNTNQPNQSTGIVGISGQRPGQ